MTTALPLLAGFFLDAALGEPGWLWARVRHPVVFAGQIISRLERRWNSGKARRFKGALAMGVLCAGAIVAGWAISLLGPLAEALTAAILLAQHSLARHVEAVARALRLSVRDGRLAVSMIVSRDTHTLTEAQVGRAAIESAAENLSDGVIAPAFWFLLAGAPGILLYKLVNTADSMVGYRNDRYRDYGWAAARLDDVMNILPARLTAILIAFPGGLADWRGIVTDARRHKSPNAGWPEAAMARRINVALAGPRIYDGKSQDLAWVNGTGKTEIGASEIDAATEVLWMVWRRAVILILAIALV